MFVVGEGTTTTQDTVYNVMSDLLEGRGTYVVFNPNLPNQPTTTTTSVFWATIKHVVLP